MAKLWLTDGERQQLLRWARRAKSAQSLALRSKIILSCADGMANTAVCGPAGLFGGDGGQGAAAVRGRR